MERQEAEAGQERPAAQDESDGESRPGRDGAAELRQLGVIARRDLEPLQSGRAIRFLGAELPVRVAAALGIFIAVFMAVWMLLWATLGGVGLGLGWMVAGAAGALTVHAYARA